MKPKLLIVDDEQAIVSSLGLILKHRYIVKTVLTIESAIQYLTNESVDVILSDLNFHGQEKDGMDLVEWVNMKGLNIPIVILSGETDVKRVMEAQRRIFDDFLVKPADSQDIVLALEKARHRALAIPEKESKAIFEVLTQDERIISQMEQIKRVMASSSNLPVFISGESGAGKEVIARYAASIRGGPFVALNMGAIPEHLQESELFGHLKGSFTGAVSDKIGKFQAAHRGVLFLDEIGETPLHLQIKLFRAIQEHEVTRVGSNTTERVDVKIVTATNQNLRQLVNEGKFREELLYRIQGLTVNIPPLRERLKDIPLIAAKFIQELSPKARPASISSDAMDALQKYSWRGNVRELRTVIEKALLACNFRVIDVHHLPNEVLGIFDDLSFLNSEVDFENLNLDLLLEQTERKAYKKALEKARGQKKEAYKILGITKSRFFRRIKELKIENVERSYGAF